MPSSANCPTSRDARRNCGGIFDFEAKEQRLAEVTKLTEDPTVWSDNKRAQELGRERKSLEDVVLGLTKIGQDLTEAGFKQLWNQMPWGDK